jgi:putative peptidoglycan lipid II flippase
MQVPQTLIGTSIATAILPTLSEMFGSQQFDALKEKIERAAKVMLTLTVPIAIIAGMVLLPLLRLFLGLEESATMRVVNVSQVFLLGIVGHSLVELFVRSFYALQKPWVPLMGSAFSLVVFILLGIVLLPVLEAVGIVSANTVAYTLQAILLLVMLNKVLPGRLNLGSSTIKSLLAAAIGGAAAYAVVNWAPGLAGSLIGAVAAFGVGILLAALVLRKDLYQIAEL